MGGAYMGQLESEAAAAEVTVLARDVTAMLANRPPRDENAPPFSRELLSLSPWLLALALHAGKAPRSSSAPALSLGDLPGRIGLLSTRVPEGALRNTLVALRSAIERIAWSGQRVAELRTEEA
jgi:hypothetical protein